MVTIFFPQALEDKQIALDIHSWPASEFIFPGKIHCLNSQMLHYCKSIVNRLLSLFWAEDNRIYSVSLKQ